MEEYNTLNQFGVSGASNSSKTFRERLADKFKPNEFVRVKNITDSEFRWVYTDPDEEQVVTPTRHERHVTHGTPRVFSLKPGETRVLPGHHAYVMVDKLFKMQAQESKDGKPSRVGARFSNPQEQNQVINEVVVEIVNPMDVMNSGASKKAVKDEVSNDLGLTDETGGKEKRAK